MKEDDESREIKRRMAASKRSGRGGEKAKDRSEAKGQPPEAQGRAEISPGTADVQGAPEWRDGKQLKRTMVSHHLLTEAAPSNTLVMGLSLFITLFSVCSEKKIACTQQIA